MVERVVDIDEARSSILLPRTMKRRIECIITGKVQGVFFRDFVKTKADLLGLFGFVKNDSGGAVTVIAEGEEEKLERFLEKIKAGTKYSKVEKVDAKWLDPQNEFSGFQIEF